MGRRARSVVRQRGHHVGDGQLRCRLRPVPARRAVDADRAHGRGRGHSRERPARRRAVGRVEQLSGVPRLPRLAPLRARCRRAARARCVAFPGDARARRRQRGRDRRRHRGDARPGRGGECGRRGRFLDLAHDLSPLDRRRRRCPAPMRPTSSCASSSRAWPTAAGECSKRSRRRRWDRWPSSVANGSARNTSCELLADISHATGQKITFTTVQHVDAPEAWRDVLAFAAEQNASGARLYPQIASRPVGILGGLAGYHPFMRRPAYLDDRGSPDRGAGAAHARSRREGAHPLRARRRVRARGVDGDVREGDAGRRRLPVRTRRRRRLRTGARVGVVRGDRGGARCHTDRSGLRLPRPGRRHAHRQPAGRGLHGGKPRRGARDDRAPDHDRRASPTRVRT